MTKSKQVDLDIQKKQEQLKKKMHTELFNKKLDEERKLAILKNQTDESSSDNHLTSKNEKDPYNIMKIYKNFIEKYNKKNLGFDEKKNTIELDRGGKPNGSNSSVICWICFDDSDAEEAFVREVAQHLDGYIVNSDIQIAELKKGKLIDPRTGEEFGEGEYAYLVTQLDSGVKYEEIKQLKTTLPTPSPTTINHPA